MKASDLSIKELRQAYNEMKTQLKVSQKKIDKFRKAKGLLNEIFTMVEHDSLATLGLLSALKAKFHYENAIKIMELERSADRMRERITTLECNQVDT